MVSTLAISHLLHPTINSHCCVLVVYESTHSWLFFVRSANEYRLLPLLHFYHVVEVWRFCWTSRSLKSEQNLFVVNNSVSKKPSPRGPVSKLHFSLRSLLGLNTEKSSRALLSGQHFLLTFEPWKNTFNGVLTDKKFKPITPVDSTYICNLTKHWIEKLLRRKAFLTKDHEFTEHLFQKLLRNDKNDLSKNKSTHNLPVRRIIEQIQSWVWIFFASNSRAFVHLSYETSLFWFLLNFVCRGVTSIAIATMATRICDSES